MHLVIIGNGITGVTCAQTVRRLQPDARITSCRMRARTTTPARR